MASDPLAAMEDGQVVLAALRAVQVRIFGYGFGWRLGERAGLGVAEEDVAVAAAVQPFGAVGAGGIVTQAVDAGERVQAQDVEGGGKFPAEGCYLVQGAVADAVQAALFGWVWGAVAAAEQGRQATDADQRDAAIGQVDLGGVGQRHVFVQVLRGAPQG